LGNAGLERKKEKIIGLLQILGQGTYFLYITYPLFYTEIFSTNDIKIITTFVYNAIILFPVPTRAWLMSLSIKIRTDLFGFTEGV
jgi:hypothetical protein